MVPLIPKQKHKHQPSPGWKSQAGSPSLCPSNFKPPETLTAFLRVLASISKQEGSCGKAWLGNKGRVWCVRAKSRHSLQKETEKPWSKSIPYPPTFTSPPLTKSVSCNSGKYSPSPREGKAFGFPESWRQATKSLSWENYRDLANG